MADYDIQQRVGQVFNTTAATANQVALTIPTYTDKVYRVEARVDAVATDNFDEGQSYGRVALFKNDGGTLTQIGSTASLWTIESVAGRDVDFNVSSTDIQLRVSPADTTPLTWVCDVTVQEISKYQANSGWQD